VETFGNKRKEGLLRAGAVAIEAAGGSQLHPAWQALIRYCSEVGHGEIACIKIQDGLPVSVEVITKKIRLC